VNALQVTIQLDTPLLLTGVGNGDENSARTLPYIPGAALRGLLIGRYAPNGKIDAPTDERAQRLFFSGAVRFLNAYPVVQGMRSLPTPASWRLEKNAQLKDQPPAPAFDFALTTEHTLDTPERVKEAFCRLNEDHDPFEVFSPPQVMNIHIGGEERGRVEKGKSTVFRYEALAAGQTLTALIVAADANDLTDVQRLIEQDPQAALGGSRSAGYGQVTLSVLSVKEWSGAEAPAGEIDDVVTITLLSDALLLDDNGQPTLDLDPILKAALKRPIEHQRAFVNPVRVGGFNRQWRLPLSQSMAAGMGSMYVYRAADLRAAELQDLVEQGVGERRVDGFGRIAVNWPGLEKFLLQKPLPADPPLPPKSLSAGSQALGREMADRLLRAELDEKLRYRVLKTSLSGSLSNHQLSRLRLVVRRALLIPDRTTTQSSFPHALGGNPEADQRDSPMVSLDARQKHATRGMTAEQLPFEAVCDHLENLKDTARRQFERARLQETNERLLSWLEARLKDNDGLAQIGGGGDPEKVAGQSSIIDDRLRREYTLRLIDGVLHKAMQDNRGKEGQA
jgi:CRISPR-associated protein Csx10